MRELNPRLLGVDQVRFHYANRPFLLAPPRGIEPRFPASETGVLSIERWRQLPRPGIDRLAEEFHGVELFSGDNGPKALVHLDLWFRTPLCSVHYTTAVCYPDQGLTALLKNSRSGIVQRR